MQVMDALLASSPPSGGKVYVLAGEWQYGADRWLGRLTAEMARGHGQVRITRVGEEGSVGISRVRERLETGDLWSAGELLVVTNLAWPSGSASPPVELARAVGPGQAVVVREIKAGPWTRGAPAEARIEAKLPPAAAWRRWVKGLSRRAGVNLTEDGLAMLCQRIPRDGYHLEQELAKMAVTPGVDRWDAEQVGRWVLPEAAEEAVWSVTDALLARDWNGFLGHLDQMLDQGEPPVRILALIGRQLVQLLHAKEASSPRDVAARDGLPGFVADKVWRAARGWSRSDAAIAIRQAGRLDRWLKDSIGEPDVVLAAWAAMLALPTGEREIPPGGGEA